MQTFHGKEAITHFIAANVTDKNAVQFNALSQMARYGIERPMFLKAFSFDGKSLKFTSAGVYFREVTLTPINLEVYSVVYRTASAEDTFHLTLLNALRLYSDFVVVGIPTKQSQLDLMLERYQANKSN